CELYGVPKEELLGKELFSLASLAGDRYMVSGTPGPELPGTPWVPLWGAKDGPEATDGVPAPTAPQPPPPPNPREAQMEMLLRTGELKGEFQVARSLNAKPGFPASERSDARENPTPDTECRNVEFYAKARFLP